MSERLLELDNISVALGGARIVQNVSLSLRQGDILTLIGPNGAGKTTLIKAVLGINPISQGSIWRRESLRMGYVPQQLQLQPTLPLTVGRFLALTNASPAECEQALIRTGLPGRMQASVHTLSGGERQRMLLTRALLRRPELLVLDEPTQGVDIAGQSALYELIRQLRDELNCGVLMISHDLHVVMAATDQVICLNQHVCCSGHPEQVSSDPAFIELFGQRIAQTLAVYHHNHNHQHDLHGNVVPPEEPAGRTFTPLAPKGQGHAATCTDASHQHAG